MLPSLDNLNIESGFDKNQRPVKTTKKVCNTKNTNRTRTEPEQTPDSWMMLIQFLLVVLAVMLTGVAL